MPDDPLDQMPDQSRTWVVTAVQRFCEIEKSAAEEVVRASEPFWSAMEDAGGLVDSWGGGEFTAVLPAVLDFIRSGEWRSR